jgi:hypothetical protein
MAHDTYTKERAALLFVEEPQVAAQLLRSQDLFACSQCLKIARPSSIDTSGW